MKNKKMINKEKEKRKQQKKRNIIGRRTELKVSLRWSIKKEMSKFQKSENSKNKTKKNEQELKEISKHNIDQGLRQVMSEQQRKKR